MIKGTKIFLSDSSRWFYLPAGHEVAPGVGEDEGPDSHDEHVAPAPLDGFLNGVNPDHHQREGEEHEPHGDEDRLLEFVHDKESGQGGPLINAP
jgi:hypothetical protein